MNLEYFDDKIKDELMGAKDYIKRAIEIKAMESSWGKNFVMMSEAELEHANSLFKMAGEFYNKTSKAYSIVPEYMKNLWDSINKCYTKEYTEIKALHEAYNK